MTTNKANHYLPYVLALAILTLSSNVLFAQNKKKPTPKSVIHQKWEIGVFLGGTQYQGDLQKTDLKEINIGIGPVVKYHFSDNFALRGNFLYGQLSGNDANYADRQGRGYSFSSPVRELSLVGEYDILGKRRYALLEQGKFTKIISPYLYAGVGFANTTPNAKFSEATKTAAQLLLINQDIAHKNNKGNLAIPVGLGVKMDISKSWTLGLEVGVRFTNTDYLDGVSLAANPDKKDTYFAGGLLLSYRIPYIKDVDNDGIADEEDSCPEVAGPLKSKGCPDKDKDGIGDRFDNCPDVAGLKSMGGCPDADRDGIADNEDLCPDMIGLKDLKGCPDADEDGISDKDDECPSEKGKKEYNGCPTRDTDADGVEDLLDKCPTLKGAKDNDGCPPKDADNDGIADKDDLCPAIKGLAKFNGCPDTDGDGIDDSKDKCPDVPGVNLNQGCPEIEQKDKDVLKNAIYGVDFESGASKIAEKSFGILDNVVDVLKKYPEYTMSISGHTDNLGKEKSNQKLSEARAKACYDYIGSKGIQLTRMSYAGYGSTIPVGENKTVAGRAKNRRVEFSLFVK